MRLDLPTPIHNQWETRYFPPDQENQSWAEIPAREKWLYESPEALAAVREDLEDIKAGRVHDLGSFAKYLED